MNFGKKMIVLIGLFTFLLSFLIFTQQLPTWLSDWQKTLLNNSVILTIAVLMVLIATK